MSADLYNEPPSICSYYRSFLMQGRKDLKVTGIKNDNEISNKEGTTLGFLQVIFSVGLCITSCFSSYFLKNCANTIEKLNNIDIVKY